MHLETFNVGDEVIVSLDSFYWDDATGVVVEIIDAPDYPGNYLVSVTGNGKDGAPFNNRHFTRAQLKRLDNEADYRSDLE